MDTTGLLMPNVTEVLDKSASVAVGSSESIELSMLLETLLEVYGYDFREYNAHGIFRRVMDAMQGKRYESIGELTETIRQSPDAAEELVVRLAVPITRFFRNTRFFRSFINEVLADFRDREFIRIWHAGCATGQEVYSLAVLLQQVGLLERSRIYATDISRRVLGTARQGSYPLKEIEEAETSFHEAGGEETLLQHFTVNGKVATISERVRSRIVFAKHDLVHEGQFQEFDLILSRNVLLHFSEKLQERVLGLYTQSLRPGGYLGLGEPESVLGSSYAEQYKAVRSVGGVEEGFYQYTGTADIVVEEYS